MEFQYSAPNWVYNLSTKGLSAGTYEMTIEMPDGGRVCPSVNGTFIIQAEKEAGDFDPASFSFFDYSCTFSNSAASFKPKGVGLSSKWSCWIALSTRIRYKPVRRENTPCVGCPFSFFTNLSTKPGQDHWEEAGAHKQLGVAGSICPSIVKLTIPPNVAPSCPQMSIDLIKLCWTIKNKKAAI